MLFIFLLIIYLLIIFIFKFYLFYLLAGMLIIFYTQKRDKILYFQKQYFATKILSLFLKTCRVTSASLCIVLDDGCDITYMVETYVSRGLSVVALVPRNIVAAEIERGEPGSLSLSLSICARKVGWRRAVASYTEDCFCTEIQRQSPRGCPFVQRDKRRKNGNYSYLEMPMLNNARVRQHAIIWRNWRVFSKQKESRVRLIIIK